MERRSHSKSIDHVNERMDQAGDLRAAVKLINLALEPSAKTTDRASISSPIAPTF